MGNTLKWAEREVEIWKEDCKDDPDIVYISGCVESALKAYKAVLEDSHSGMSWCITKDILTTLMEGKPLTLLADREEDWDQISDNKWQNKRYSKLFKKVDEDGVPHYHDIGRFTCIDQKGAYFANGFIFSEVEKLVDPIKMPYYPGEIVRIYVHEYKFTDKPGDFDTIFIDDCFGPYTGVVKAKTWYKEDDEGHMQKVTDKMEIKRLEEKALEYNLQY